MTTSGKRAGNVPASFLWLLIAGCTVSSCAGTGLRIVTPANAPRDVSYRWSADDWAHQGLSIGGPGSSGHEIVAAADGMVVVANYNELRGSHIKILHGLNSNGQNIFTEYLHVHGSQLKRGDPVKRGQTIGYIRRGQKTDFPHSHFILTEEESPGNYIVLDLSNFWCGIDQYKEKVAKDPAVGPFTISCFDPSVNYPKEPIRFTYPVKCG